MFGKRKIKLCENCDTGRKTYELDCSTAFCPYLIHYEDKECFYYKPTKKIEVSKCEIKLTKKLFNFISSKCK